MGNQETETSLNGSQQTWVLLSVLGRATHPLWSFLPTCIEMGWTSSFLLCILQFY